MTTKITKRVLSIGAAMVTATTLTLPAAKSAGDARADARRAHLEALYVASDPESPARFRLIEELDRLSGGGGVTGSEHSQFRRVEDGA